MVGDCPSDFLQLAFNCCNVSLPAPPSLPRSSLPCPAHLSPNITPL